MNKLTYFLLSVFLFTFISLRAEEQPEFSTAGFFKLNNTGREVYSMNPAWRLHKGNIANAESLTFDDSKWSVVSLPDGIETVPEEASGCVNYQGVVWYRKHFQLKDEMMGKKLFLHFEAIMGKSKIYMNGKLLAEHFGGYLPVIVDVSEHLKWGEDNVIAVWADNSDDPIYPPGKAQDVLDFTYMGGIYRDCWLVSHNDVYITDPNYVDKVAGGGLLVSTDKLSKAKAELSIQLNLKNESLKKFGGKVEFVLKTKDGKTVLNQAKTLNINKGKDFTVKDKFVVDNPIAWSPQNPFLYNLEVRVKNNEGSIVDGYRQRVGIRTIEFKGKDGFWLNGELYPEPLIGGNRHQDYALVGNAVSNNAHWRDVKKMRDAGMKVIRNAHSPQDPAFMDACDELGMFVIANTPGWQFWNDEPIFEKRVYEDIRSMVRRDRNRACVWMWEPILNETWYPADFAGNTRKIVEEEYSFANCYNASDQQARGSEHFNIHFSHPLNGEVGFTNEGMKADITYFTREWGDNVDDWSSHNSPSRTTRNWGEQAMLVQAQHYAKPYYQHTCIDALYRAWNASPQHVGGTLWHTFDHQRGYHPDPFYGGIMDAYRQPKFSFYMFQSQQTPYSKRGDYVAKPMVHIAHEMSPFSSKDVTVYSNCDLVKLKFTADGKFKTYQRDKNTKGIPYPVITFADVFDFMVDKKLSRDNKHKDSYLYAEGYIDGKLVATDTVFPTRRPSQLLLTLDNEGTELKADGSDFVAVIASVADANGNIKRLNNYKIVFDVEGEGELINSAQTFSNPMPVQWGTTPALIRSTTKAGKIRVSARVFWEGSQMPTSSELVFKSKPATVPMIYDLMTLKSKKNKINISLGKSTKKRADANKLKEVEKQQTDFGEIR